MFQIRRGKYYFILIDFDMAIVIITTLSNGDGSTYVASSKFRTGTLPFMACRLLEDAACYSFKNWKPIKHRLCHDIESLFWVALWCALALFLEYIEDRAERRALDKRVQSWEKGSLTAIAAQKQVLCIHKLSRSNITLPGPVANLSPWFDAWARLFQLANTASTDREWEVDDAAARNATPEPFDEETIGGTFSRENLKKYLTPKMPTRQEVFGEDELVSDEEDPSDNTIEVNDRDDDVATPSLTIRADDLTDQREAPQEPQEPQKAKPTEKSKAKSKAKVKGSRQTNLKAAPKPKTGGKGKVASAMAAAADTVRSRLRTRKRA